MILTAAAFCMALNIYHEARGESFSGQVAVAQVTMNRVEKKHSNTCKVVFEDRQFSWTNGQFKRNAKGQVVLSDSKIPKATFTKVVNGKKVVVRNSKWDTAMYIAKHLKRFPDYAKGSMFYHATYVEPRWDKRKLVHTVSIGKHVFYRNASAG